MNIDSVNNPVATVIHWLVTSGVLLSVISFANSTENKTLENQTKLQAIKETQAEIKQDVKEGRQAQEELKSILIEIKTKVDGK